MEQWTYRGIDESLLEAVRKVAAEQGRDEGAVIEEALRRYLDESAASTIESLNREQERQQKRGFVALLDRMSSRFDLDEEEAMELANSELRAMHEERRAAWQGGEEEQK